MVNETTTHQLSDLFAQLGLPSDPTSIDHFIDKYRPFATETKLADAFFWSPAQAAFLREEMLNDADWVVVIDQLNQRLHAKN